ncbi:MAG: biotin/lipoyl-binding protein, partial [Anaerolineales bacterium]|nr:biotin/lipoyl-binding protein [Anaerolineales bacterium]
MKRIVTIAVIVVVVAIGAVVALRGPSVAVQVMKPKSMIVREYVAEDAKTRLADEYIIDMPVTGTVLRIDLDEGDDVEKGQVVARVDAYDIKQNIRRVDAQIAQRQAQMLGVDVAKPKPEDIESAKLRVEEMKNALEIAHKAITVTQANFDEASRSLERAQGLLKAGAASESFLDEAQRRYTALEAELNQRRIEVERARQALDQAHL